MGERNFGDTDYTPAGRSMISTMSDALRSLDTHADTNEFEALDPFQAREDTVEAIH